MNHPLIWPHWLDEVWAKSPERGANGQAETLAEHTWWVLSRLADFIHLRPDVPVHLNQPRLWHILFWATFLHDFGKAAAGFQARLRGGARWHHRHEILSLGFVDWIAADFRREELHLLIAAIGSHHKDSTEIQRLYSDIEPDDPADDLITPLIAEVETAHIRGMWQWLTDCGAAWIEALRLGAKGVTAITPLTEAQAMLLVNAKRLRYWLRLWRKWDKALKDDFPSMQIWVTGIALRGHIINADHGASAHTETLPRLNITRDGILGTIIKKDGTVLTWADLFDHQREAGSTPGSALLIAPTGSGKTEAALLWAAYQATGRNGTLPRLFYTLPYQASMNAMHRRLETTFGEREQVGLQHGRGLLALYRLLLEREYDPKAAAREAYWLKNMNQLNRPPIRVFSPYQMLKGPYRLKGYEALLSDYHDAVFIFDEIHAYEVKRLALILALIKYLRIEYHARFFVMSATFPSLIQRWLDDALGTPHSIKAADDLFTDFTRHRLELLDGEVTDETALRRMEADARTGKAVLVVCNLVDRAQIVYQTLTARLAGSGVATVLLHGRFNVRDRLAKEKIVGDKTSSRLARQEPVVLVATQAVEVSLDIDLDTIYSDPAPLEALVQRFGRVNRARKKGIVPVHVFRQPRDGQKIYDAELVERTLVVLEREQGRTIEESRIGTWLDEIYAGTIADRWQKEYTQAYQQFERDILGTLYPFASSRELEKEFFEAFDSIEVLPGGASYEEFLHLQESDPIRAWELVVTIRYGRYHQLKRSGRLRPAIKDKENNIPSVVEVYYDSEVGLDFQRPYGMFADEDD